MGFGDEIMITGRVRSLPGRSAIVDKNGKRRWHDIWRGHPQIAGPGEAGDHIIKDGSGCRPYIEYERSTRERWAYTAWRCSPGRLCWVRPDERGRGRIIIEPHIKHNASPNKQWGWANWQALARLGCFAQVGVRGAQWLDGVERIETDSFETAVNVLAAADAAILPEGGLHHACAAIGTPAVVLFGAMTSPANTGYDAHENLFIDDPGALGWRIPHERCLNAWKLITPERVTMALEKVRRMRN